MPFFRLNAFLPPITTALRSPRAFANATMLKRAVGSHASSRPSQPRSPLQADHNAKNASNKLESNKRKFERTISSTSNLGALHENVFFTENDFDDDVAIDLTDSLSPPRKKAAIVRYPALDKLDPEITYPTLHSASTQKSNGLPSSPPVPWSSSPPSHFEASRPNKGRTVPWIDKNGNKTPSFTPLPQNKSTGERYPWNKTASALKDEQKELRKRNRERALGTGKPESEKRSATPQVPTTFLSEEQRHIIDAVIQQKKSVFFTGSAGTGKSVLMRSIISRLRDMHRKEPDRIAVTASTGLAACNIEGITLHSFAGIGLGKEAAPELVKKIRRNAKLKQRWQRVKALIIDEISMVDGDLFDKLEQIARAIKNSGQPFGGIQLIVTGDFFQLPPVPERDKQAKFAFDAATWGTSIEHTILLTHVFRQKDPVFAGMLNEMRLGKLTPNSIKAFQRLSRPLAFEDEVEATELFPTRGEVDNANSMKMRNLSGELMTFNATDSGILDLKTREKHLSNFMAQETLTLRKGAQVMLIKNIDSQLVNGSLGKVIAFMDESTFTFYRDDEETYMRVHRAEGDGGVGEDENAKARRKLADMRRKDGDGPKRVWPMVRFTLADNTSRTLLCQSEEWKTEAPGGEIVAKRVQVPLILAWALSIHKAQGQTLERVKVDLGKVFEKGQAYVALSRATNQAGLQVTRFDARKVMVHPKVVGFYEKLVSIQSIQAVTANKSNVDKQRAVIELSDDEEEALCAIHG